MDLGVKPLSFTSSCPSWKSNDRVSDQFPAGLRVLVVDDDPTCLMILEKMLRNCLYEATTCNRAEIALKYLRDNRNGYDIVISDVHMPDMDGFKLLEHVGLEMDLPVIMMSADDSKNVVMKGVTHGACDYLIKPVRMEALKNIWQHVVRKKKYEWKEKDSELSGSVDDGRREQKLPEDLDYSSSANEGTWRGSKKRKDEEDEAEERDDSSTLKKPRVVWSVELHQQFVTAVNQLGIDKAVPKKILELMSVPGLTRENVASHLQKYRLYLRRLSGVSQHPNGLSNSFLGPPDVAFGPMSSLNGTGLQAFSASGPLQPQSLATIQAAALGRGSTKPATPVSLVDQRHLFGLENSKLRFVEGQQQQSGNTKQVNLLHGIPTNMDSKQLATFRQSAQPFGNMNMQVQPQAGQSNALLTPTTLPQSRTHTLNETNGSHVSTLPSSSVLSCSNPSAVLGRNGMDCVLGTAAHTTTVSQPSIGVNFSRSLSTEFPGSNFSVASNSGISSLTSKHQDEFNPETKGSRGFLLNYDVFENVNQNRIQDWHFQNVGSTIKAPQHPNAPAGLDILPSGSVPQQFTSNQWASQSRAPFIKNTMFSVSEGFSSTPNTGGQQNFSPLSDNQLRIKAERLPDMGFQNGLFPDHFGQEDLMSALLKQHQEGIGPPDTDLGFDGYQLDNLPV